MKFGKQKRHRRAVRFYSTCFDFRRPYKVLCDGPFIHNLIKHRIAPADDAISHTLGGPVKLFTTKCILAEIVRLGKSYSAELNAARMLDIARCDHEKVTGGFTCISEVIGENNSEHFFLASNDAELRTKFREVAGVPRLFGLNNALFLEKLSERERNFVKNSEQARLHMTESELKALKKKGANTSGDDEISDSSDEDGGFGNQKSTLMPVKEIHTAKKGMHVKDSVQFKRRKAKGPNPLSCKKKRSRVIANHESEKTNKGDDDAGKSSSRKRKRSRKGNKPAEETNN